MSFCLSLIEGTGINEEHLEKLGRPFFTTKDEGTGLGLAICYSIAARHHASIEVSSSAKGTTFLIRFPIQLKHTMDKGLRRP